MMRSISVCVVGGIWLDVDSFGCCCAGGDSVPVSVRAFSSISVTRRKVSSNTCLVLASSIQASKLNYLLLGDTKVHIYALEYMPTKLWKSLTVDVEQDR